MSDILLSIYDSIAEINRQLPEDQQLIASPDTVIIGESGVLDSLGVINFLVSLEERLSQKTGQSISLLDETLIGDADGPLKTIGSIESFVRERL